MTQELIRLVTAGETVFGIAREPDDITRVGISGHLLYSNRDQLKQLVVDEIERGHRAFILDLTRCGYIDSAGLGVVVSISRKISQAGGTLVIENLNEDLVALFQLTKLDTLLTTRAAPAKAANDGRFPSEVKDG